MVYARQFFAWGMKRDLVESNPFTEVRAGSQKNASRIEYVSADTIDRVTDHAPTAEWRALIAICRYCGLRVGEALRLCWADIDWSIPVVRVRSSKTEHHTGGEMREVPLFPRVQEFMLDLRELAVEGEERVFSGVLPDSNTEPQLKRIVLRTGVEPWQKIFHALRASCEMDLIQRFPLSSACYWIGNSQRVVVGHYIKPTDADFERAMARTDAESDARLAHITTQHAPVPRSTDPQREVQSLVSGRLMQRAARSCGSVQGAPVGDTGLEPVTSSMSTRRASQLRQSPIRPLRRLGL